MKIYNDEKKVIFEGKLDINTLDFENMKDNASFIIPINDENMITAISDTAWESLQREWNAADDEKLEMLLYINLCDSEFEPNFQYVAFPYLPSEENIKDEINHACDDEAIQDIKNYYELVKDYYETENNGCGLGEYFTLNMELTDEEKMDLMYEIIQELVFPNSRVKTHEIGHAA
jgi:hypothetical protein